MLAEPTSVSRDPTKQRSAPHMPKFHLVPFWLKVWSTAPASTNTTQTKLKATCQLQDRAHEGLKSAPCGTNRMGNVWKGTRYNSLTDSNKGIFC